MDTIIKNFGNVSIYSFRLAPFSCQDVSTKLTIGRDSHANALQHEIIARAVFKFLMKTDLATEIMEQVKETQEVYHRHVRSDPRIQ